MTKNQQVAAFSLIRKRMIFGVAILAYMLSQFYRSFLTIIATPLSHDLGVGPRELGALGSAWFIVFACAQFPIGAALDRWGARRTMSFFMIFAIIGAIFFALSQSFTQALLASALNGLGCAPLLMGTLYFFARTETPARFAFLSSIFLGAGMVGGLFAANPLIYAVAHWGWRFSIGAMAIVTIFSALLIFIVMRDPPQVEVGAQQKAESLWSLLRVRKLWPIFFMSIFITAEIWTIRTLWIGPYLEDVHGFIANAPTATWLNYSNIILLFAISMTLSAILAGPIASAWGRPKTIVQIGTAIATFGFFMLGLWVDAPFWVDALFFLVIGLFGGVYAVQISHARLFMPAHLVGRGMTFINFLSIGGTGLLQYGSGILVETLKQQKLPANEIYGALHLSFGCILALAWLVYCFAPEKE